MVGRVHDSVAAATLSLLSLAACCHADWMVTPPDTPAIVTAKNGGCTLVLRNGLVARTFAVPGPGCASPNFVTTDLVDTTDPDMPPKSVLAALDVEAAVELDGMRWNVGGLNASCARWVRSAPHVTQVEKHPKFSHALTQNYDPKLMKAGMCFHCASHEQIFSTCAYLNRSQPSYARPRANASAFQYAGHSTGPTLAPFEYTAARHAAITPWPPLGVHLAGTVSGAGVATFARLTFLPLWWSCCHCPRPSFFLLLLRLLLRLLRLLRLWLWLWLLRLLRLRRLRRLLLLLSVNFTAPPTAPAKLKGIRVTVHYELYQGVPAMSKWVTIAAAATDTAAANVMVANVFVEQLRVNDDFAGSSYPIADGWVTGTSAHCESAYEDTTHSVLSPTQPPLLLLQTDTFHGTGCSWGSRAESTYAR